MSSQSSDIHYRLKEPVPYIQGFGLTYPQLDVVASAVLPYDTIKSYYGDVLVALRVELRKAGQDFTIIPFTTGPKCDREVRYLYILDVIPSWTGKRPQVTVPRETAEKFFNLYHRNKWLKILRVFCIRWPSYEPVKIYGDWVKQSMTPEEIEETMQGKVVETEEEFKALKLSSSQDINMDVIPAATTPTSNESTALEIAMTARQVRGENSNVVVQAILPSEAPVPAPVPSQPILMASNRIGPPTPTPAKTTRRKRKVAPLEPTHTMTRPKRACTMKKK